MSLEAQLENEQHDIKQHDIKQHDIKQHDIKHECSSCGNERVCSTETDGSGQGVADGPGPVPVPVMSGWTRLLDPGLMGDDRRWNGWVQPVWGRACVWRTNLRDFRGC
jgi:hypothetical protein